MERSTKQNGPEGTSISVPIPPGDASLFAHKATGDVLTFLARHPHDRYTISDLASNLELTKPAVSRAVDSLAANALVVDDPKGNRREVTINSLRLSRPDDPLLTIPQPEFHRPVGEAVTVLKYRLDDVIGIVLFGSVARGAADRRSDIDLWVVVEDDRAENQREANRAVKDLEDESFDGERYGFDVDVEAAQAVGTYVDDLREILRSGITLYQTSGFERVEQLVFEGAQNE